MGDRKNYLTDQLVKYCQKLDQKGFGANHDGNISAKFEDTLLATPTAESKGNITADMIIALDQTGKKIAGIGKPFSEISLHLAAYNARDNVAAVVHAHPPFATARGLVGKSLAPTMPEAIVSIGDLIPVVEFAMPGTEESSIIVSKALESCDVFMLPGNGVLAVGANIEMAYLRLELTEHLAKIHFYAEQQGTLTPLSANNMEKLLAKHAAVMGAPLKKRHQASAEPTQTPATSDELTRLITAEIKKLL
ncbi:MAG: class II aldolase/adducin family protein [Gammaproteobacteria bacterium]|nr:class II aldolase/adducin family protein [Gammaproteobacteria bacterium]